MGSWFKHLAIPVRHLEVRSCSHCNLSMLLLYVYPALCFQKNHHSKIYFLQSFRFMSYHEARGGSKHWTKWRLKMGQTGSPETSVQNHLTCRVTTQKTEEFSWTAAEAFDLASFFFPVSQILITLERNTVVQSRDTRNSSAFTWLQLMGPRGHNRRAKHHYLFVHLCY